MQRSLRISVLLCDLLVAASVAHAADSLGVILTADPHLSAVARKALMAEATEIWERAGVRLEWIPATAPRPSTEPTLRIVAIPWPPRKSADKATIVGELLRVSPGSAVAMVSLDEAERIIARLPQHAAASRDQRIGLILGRAAAHEIGHFILDTSTHVDHGLMRARFADRDFADPQSSSFTLDSH